VNSLTSLQKSLHTRLFQDQATKIGTWLVSILIISLAMRLLFLHSSKLLVEEAYYWNYAMHLDFGYLDHPPMVALLIKMGTLLFGNTEFAVRMASPLCWCGTLFFSYKLTEYFSKGAGIYALFLLFILPFPFLHSMIITPDVPLLLCWSAVLYYLYKALVLDNASAWYKAGLWCGLGLLAKYTIVLLPLATFIYLITVKNARKWLFKKEPWLALLIAGLLFTPVIYWNATHGWVSFTFQSTNRMLATFHFSLPTFIGLVCLFFTPAGIFALYQLMANHDLDPVKNNRSFFLYYTLIPLLFFGLFSVFRLVKFNWMGPVILALIPWLSLQIQHNHRWGKYSIRNIWLATGSLFLCGCIGFFAILYSGQPAYLYQKLFTKYIDWQAFTLKIHHIVQEAPTKTTPLIIPLDMYNMASQFNFYQAKLFDQGYIDRIFPVSGRHVLGVSSLMYDYWTPSQLPPAQPVLLIAKKAAELQAYDIYNQINQRSELLHLLPSTQGNSLSLQPYYYQFGVAG